MKTKSEPKIKEEKTEKKPVLAGFLREKRQARNLTVEKLSDITKIQAYNLKALEEGRFSDLPPAIYREGILKRLAKFLEIEENEILKMYDAEAKEPETADVNNAVSPKRNFYFILTPSKITLFAGGVILLALSVYLWYQFSFLFGPPTLIMEPKEDLITKDEIVSVKGRTDSGVDVKINGEGVYVASNGGFSKEIQLAAGANVIEITAMNRFGKSTKLIRQIFREQ